MGWPDSQVKDRLVPSERVQRLSLYIYLNSSIWVNGTDGNRGASFATELLTEASPMLEASLALAQPSRKLLSNDNIRVKQLDFYKVKKVGGLRASRTDLGYEFSST